MATKSAMKNSGKPIKDLPAKNVKNREARKVKGGVTGNATGRRGYLPVEP